MPNVSSPQEDFAKLISAALVLVPSWAQPSAHLRADNVFTLANEKTMRRVYVTGSILLRRLRSYDSEMAH